MSSHFVQATWMAGAAMEGYGSWPIPDQADRRIAALLRCWSQLSTSDRESEIATVTEEQKALLRAFSERMASAALRNRDRDALVLGLIALGIDGGTIDWREDIMILALHVDAARRLGMDPDGIIRQACRALPDQVAKVLMEFTARPPREQSIDAMGYELSVEQGGVRYRRNW